MQKRRQEREKLFESSQSCATTAVDSLTSTNFSQNSILTSSQKTNQAFLTNENHFLKRVKKHPERDMADFVRIIDQESDHEL